MRYLGGSQARRRDDDTLPRTRLRIAAARRTGVAFRLAWDLVTIDRALDCAPGYACAKLAAQRRVNTSCYGPRFERQPWCVLCRRGQRCGGGGAAAGGATFGGGQAGGRRSMAPWTRSSAACRTARQAWT